MGREFARLSVNFETNYDLSSGLDDSSLGINSVNFYGPRGSSGDISSAFSSLNNIASNNTKYTIIDVNTSGTGESGSTSKYQIVQTYDGGLQTYRVRGTGDFSAPVYSEPIYAILDRENGDIVQSFGENSYYATWWNGKTYKVTWRGDRWSRGTSPFTLYTPKRKEGILKEAVEALNQLSGYIGGGDSIISGANVLDSPILAFDHTSLTSGSRTYTLSDLIPDSAKFVVFSCRVSDSQNRGGRIFLEIIGGGATIQADRATITSNSGLRNGHLVSILPRADSYTISWGNDTSGVVKVLGWI